MFVYNRSKGCLPPFAPANWDTMSRYRIDLVVFLAGLAAVCWIAAGYLGSNPLALAVTLLIGVCYLAGALEFLIAHTKRKQVHAAAELRRPAAKLLGRDEDQVDLAKEPLL